MIITEAGPDGHPALWQAPARIVAAWAPEDLPRALADLARARAEGYWLAGYASYELGYLMVPGIADLLPQGRRVPLLLMAAYAGPNDARPLLAADHGPAALGVPQPDWSERGYRAAFERVADYIAAGDTYQVNLTMPMRTMASGSPLALFAGLNRVQPVGHAALVDLGVGPAVISRSPELFFEADASGLIATRPMKGTAPRAADPGADIALAEALAHDPKNRAENLMIVDLMRNDLSRLCLPGSVRVPELFSVEHYATVHQMTSLVTGQLAAPLDLQSALQAIFPCGSITGAPKRRAMEIIRELEPSPRDVYCGAIGWLAPDGRARFNVAIRTISLFDGREVVLNVGGGVVHDSTAAAEYQEALWKARYARLEP